MEIRFKAPNEEHISLNTGDTLTGTSDEGTWVWMVIEDDRFITDGCFALNTLSAPDKDDVGMYTTDGWSFENPSHAENDPDKLIENLRNNGFKNIKKVNFTLVEE